MYTRKELAELHNQIVSNLERAWEITGRSEDELTGVMVQISQVVNVRFWPKAMGWTPPPLIGI